MGKKNAASRKKRYDLYSNTNAKSINKEKRRKRYLKSLRKKKLQLEARGRSTVRIEQEIAYVNQDETRPDFITGRDANALQHAE